MLGSMHKSSFIEDPKHLGFVLARYKFVARMFQDTDKVLEVGCGDGTGANVVRQSVVSWFGIDIKQQGLPSYRFQVHDILQGPFGYDWNAIYALDVMEHIAPSKEENFIYNIHASMSENASLIIGMPSLESQIYASPNSLREHVNCKTEEGLRSALKPWFHHVFMFGMNDETLTTGFGPMCHYRLAVCSGKK